MQRRGVIEPVAPVDVEAARQQQLDARDMATGGGVVQQRAIPGAAGDVNLAGMLAEQPRELVRIAGRRRSDDLAVEAHRVDMRLERAPALEAVVIGNVALRQGELG